MRCKVLDGLGEVSSSDLEQGRSNSGPFVLEAERDMAVVGLGERDSRACLINIARGGRSGRSLFSYLCESHTVLFWIER